MGNLYFNNLNYILAALYNRHENLIHESIERTYPSMYNYNPYLATERYFDIIRKFLVHKE